MLGPVLSPVFVAREANRSSCRQLYATVLVGSLHLSSVNYSCKRLLQAVLVLVRVLVLDFSTRHIYPCSAWSYISCTVATNRFIPVTRRSTRNITTVQTYSTVVTVLVVATRTEK